MAYTRRNIIDGQTIIDKDHYDNLQDGIEEVHEYVDDQLALIHETGIPKLLMQVITVVATEEGQTVFPIKLTDFDHRTDTVRVYSGSLRLSPNGDFTVDPDTNSIVLTNGVPLARAIDIEVLKNIPIGSEGSVSGRVVSPKTLPNDRLEKDPLSFVGGVHNFATYSSFEQIGVTTGSETVGEIVSKLPDASILIVTIGTPNNGEVYPYHNINTSGDSFGTLIVTKHNEFRIIFEFYDKASFRYWRGSAEASGTWSGWEESFRPDGSVPMTGGIKFSPTTASHVHAVKFKDNTGQVWICGGVDDAGGSSLVLYGKDSGSLGRFLLKAKTSEKTVDLVGNADGTLTWGGKKLFGEHNPEALATQIQNIISSGEYGVGVKSIQKGDINIASGQSTGTATLKTSVNPDKTVVIFSGYTTNVNLGSIYVPRLDLAGNTTVLASLNSNLPSGASMTVPYQVVEYI